MLSKTVTDRVRANGSVLAALQHLAPMLENQGAALFAPHLKKGETLPDLAFLATLLQRVLQSQGAAMEKADSDHNDELADDLEPRERRDEAVRDLYSSLVDLKQGTGALFGESWVSRLKLPGTLPQEPVALVRLAGDVKDALEKASLPKPRVPGVKSFDKQPWIAQVGKPTAELATALEDVAREAREAQGTLIKKTRAISAFDEAFSKGVALTAALLRMVGEAEHADRLRPSARRPGTLAVDEPPPVDASEPAAGEDATGQDGAPDGEGASGTPKIVVTAAAVPKTGTSSAGVNKGASGKAAAPPAKASQKKKR